MALTNGLVVMTPTSVDKTGSGSSVATINSDGSVYFHICSSVSLNGVFTSSYDNYMVVMNSTVSSAGIFQMRLRTAGTDDTSTANYNSQLLNSDSTSVSGSRRTADGYWFIATSGLDTSHQYGRTIYIFGPNLTQPTAYRAMTIDPDVVLKDSAGTHELSSSYDGITISASSGSMGDGLVTVFGFNQ